MSDEPVTYRGNWRRVICRWWGHENIGTRNLLWGTPEVVCLRCRASSHMRPPGVWDDMLRKAHDLDEQRHRP